MADDAMAVFRPELMGGLMKAAEQLAKSSLIPAPLRGKAGDVLVVLLTGREFGLGPMQALRGIHVIDGKPVMAADLMVGLCLSRRELCEHFTLVETSAERATYKTKRTGQPETTLTWTIKQAQAAGVTNKDNWRKYPDAMLRARCASALARAVYPDLLAGTYDPDELDANPAASGSSKAARASRAENQSKSEEPPAPTLERVDEPPAPAPAQERQASATPAEAPPTAAPKPRAPSAVVAFGPLKGRPVAELSDEELGAAIDLANEKLMEEPRASWSRTMRKNLEELEAEVEFRLARAAPVATREPGSDG